MATYRIGIGSFNLKDGAVGIGTESSGLGNLKVEGTYKTTDLDVTGVSTFTRYAGFAPDNLEIGKDSRDRTLTGEHFTTGDIVVGVNSTFTVSTGATVTVGAVESVSIGTHFSPPTGGIEDRPEVPVEGTVRFNKDLNTLEFYNGVEWRQFNVSGQSGRGIFGAGTHYTPGTVDSSWIAYINIASKGNTENFGDLINNPRDPGACSSRIRGFFMGGDPPPNGSVSDVIQYITMASTGDALDFGNLTNDRRSPSALSSSTRGVICGGYDDQASANQNTIDYIEMATVGDSLDFGDLRTTIRAMGSASNGTRGIVAGGWTPAVQTQIDSLNIASKGNTVRFGDLQRAKTSMAGGSNTVRALFAGGYRYWDSAVNDIDMVTIESDGNAVDFGELVTARMSVTNCMAASETTGVIAGGTYMLNGGGTVKQSNMESVKFHSAGKATVFGDLDRERVNVKGMSDSHGGLGGY